MNNSELFKEAYLSILIQDAAKQSEVQTITFQPKNGVFKQNSNSENNLNELEQKLSTSNTSIKNVKELIKANLTQKSFNEADFAENTGAPETKGNSQKTSQQTNNDQQNQSKDVNVTIKG